MNECKGNKKVLFISGSLGLGHVTRDLAIARELRRHDPELEISWLAAPPAAQLIEAEGERLLPQAGWFGNLSIEAESVSRAFRLDLAEYSFQARSTWHANVAVFQEVVRRDSYDLVIGDETYEISIALKRRTALKKFPFVMIYDFVGLDAMSRSSLEKFAVYLWNRMWARPGVADLSLFVGEIEDVPDRPFGFRLPNRRQWARAHYTFIGYILPFDPQDCTDRTRLRTELGYGPEPLIVCSIGGTSIGKELLELCAQSFPFIRERVPDARMLLVCGPRLAPETLKVSPGVEIRGYVPALYRHFAVCDLAIVQAGGASTLELTALRRPFLYFPIEGHCEQELGVSERLARHRAGERLVFSQTQPSSLAERALRNLGQNVSYPPIPTDGARKAAQLIGGLLETPTHP
jgi:UDP:flavonoid glycosyltransferase YjiC (YdhE family)